MDGGRRHRLVATVLATLILSTIAFLVVGGPRLLPESELGLWLGAAVIFLPFVSLLVLAFQVWYLARRQRGSDRALSPATRLLVSMLGPVGLAWAVFRFTSGSGATPGDRDGLAR